MVLIACIALPTVNGTALLSPLSCAFFLRQIYLDSMEMRIRAYSSGWAQRVHMYICVKMGYNLVGRIRWMLCSKITPCVRTYI